MAMGGLSKLANLSITLQRRWSNVLSDQQRQHVVEMFLGLRTDAYFPLLACCTAQTCRSRRAATIVRTLPKIALDPVPNHRTFCS